MNFDSKVTQESTTCPGVKFTVRRLNVIQRAKRDLAIAEHRQRYAALNAEYRFLVREALGDITKDPEWRERLPSIDPNKQARMIQSEEEAENVYREHILPVVLRTGLLSIEGLVIAGEPATVDSLIESGPDELLTEIHKACEREAGLNGEEQKNLQSPGTSAGQENGKTQHGNADPAAPTSTTESMAAATAGATSPAT